MRHVQPPSTPRLAALVLAASSLFATQAHAHPHVFVDARAELQFDTQGDVIAIRNVWRFDDAFSAFATQGLDADGDGTYSPEELAPLAKVNVDSLREFDYFTIPKLAGKRLGLKLPVDYSLAYADGYLTLFYTLPLKQPVKPTGDGLTVEIYDPSYFVDFVLVKDEPALAVGAPKGCALTVARKGDLDPASAAALAQIPASQRDLPSEYKSLTASLANTVKVKCP